MTLSVNLLAFLVIMICSGLRDGLALSPLPRSQAPTPRISDTPRNDTGALQDLLQDIRGNPQAKRAREASIHRIRRALAVASRLEVEYIKNMRGVGYQLVLEGSSSKPNP